MLSRIQLFVIPWTAACQVSLSITNSQSLLTRSLVYHKGYQGIQINSQMKTHIGWGSKQRDFCPCGVWGLAWWYMEAFGFTNLKVLQFQIHLMADSLHRHAWLHHWWLNSISSFSPFPGQGWDWKFQVSITWLAPLATSLHPLVGSTSHLVNTSRDTFIAFITENGKGFSSSVPKIGTKTKHALLTMNHNIAQELLKVWSWAQAFGRNASSQAHPRPTESECLGWGPGICVFSNSPGNIDALWSLRSSALPHTHPQYFPNKF